MAAPRASWDHAYEKGLVDIMLDHNNPICRGQNGWTAEGGLELKQSKLVDELKESKQDDIFSIGNCVAALEPMEDLSVAEKAKALRLFKCPMNREIFINTKDSNLRLYWLKEEISEM